MKILDIDLDFFLDNRHCGTVTSVERLSIKSYNPWTVKEVEHFLANNCGLEKTSKVPGNLFTHHDEVFYFLRQLQERADFSLSFSIDHLDAHCDLGTGDLSYKYIATSILNKPLKERAYPDKTNGWEGLSPGNFLSFAIACRWVNRLRYITNVEWIDDTPWFGFKNFETESNTIQPKQFSENQMNEIINGKAGDMKERARLTTPLANEPEIPFDVIDWNTFKNSEKYDFIFLIQSPGFTPKKSDNLIPIIKQYMKLE